MEDKYEYKDLKVEVDPTKDIRFGTGEISGYISLMLGFLSLLAVFAYLFPAYLTTYELRQLYDAVYLQDVLKYAMYTALFFGFVSLVFSPKRNFKYAGLGILFTTAGFLLGGHTIPIGSVEPVRLSLGVDWLILAFLGSIAIFMTLEKLFPKYREQQVFRPEWETDIYYFCFNHLAISAILIFANSHAAHFDWAQSQSLQSLIQSIPVYAQVILVILCADFVLYWEHRAYHEIKPLWPVHAVHHSVEQLDWLAGSRGHFIQVFSERAMVMIPLYLLGVSESALNFYVAFAALQAVFIHCNLNLPLGPIKFIFVTPQFHHWHHSSEKPAIDTNYSAHTVLFDRLFGTYHMPKDYWPSALGTTNRLPRTIIGQTLYPLSANIKRYFNIKKLN